MSTHVNVDTKGGENGRMLNFETFWSKPSVKMKDEISFMEIAWCATLRSTLPTKEDSTHSVDAGEKSART
jgi:hypothetical protein